MVNIFSILDQPVRLQEIKDPLLEAQHCGLFVLRLDELHPLISGNKLFKLYYFLQAALETDHRTVITFGGAWSNHLAATAEACAGLELNSIGIVRGEKPQLLSNTLQQCQKSGMKLFFVPRNVYAQKSEEFFTEDLHQQHGPFILIPEGGASVEGRLGAEKITTLLKGRKFSHVCCATGTGTTIAGLSSLRAEGTEIIGFTVLKGLKDLEHNLQKLLPGEEPEGYKFFYDYHFGGYAKKTSELVLFMNNFFRNHQIPTDFVYTAKMFYGVWDLLGKNYFPFNSKILCLHTGGLQGNLSLPPNMLAF